MARFSGSMVALITPFQGGAIDHKALADLVERQIVGGSSALVPCGSTGESATLSHAEHIEVIKAVIVPEKGAKPDPAEVTQYMKQRLASYKAPTYYAIVDELPRNPMGKVLKTELRKLHGSPGNSF